MDELIGHTIPGQLAVNVRLMPVYPRAAHLKWVAVNGCCPCPSAEAIAAFEEEGSEACGVSEALSMKMPLRA
jgi:hypothetical protein